MFMNVRILLLLVSLNLTVGLALTTSAQEAKPATGDKSAAKVDASVTRGEPLVFAATNNQVLLDARALPLRGLVTGPNDDKITRLTTLILEQYQYLQHPLDRTFANRFLDRYLEVLDGLHIHFLQTDIQEFDAYRPKLVDMTEKAGDITPGQKIFSRFLERLEQRVAYVGELLTTEKFEFKGDDRYNWDRRKSPRAKDLDEAKQIWRQHLRYEILQEKLNKEKAEDIAKKITRRYALLLRTFKEYDNDDVLELYLSALAHAYDPHSDYMGKSALESFNIQMKLSLFGIGALLRSEDGYCKILSLVAAGPAERSKKLKENDRIIAVAQGANEPVDVVEMKLNKVVDLIRGPKGTEVRLTVIPADATDPSVRKTVSLIRDEIRLEEQEAKAKIIDHPDEKEKHLKLGVIDLPSFYADFGLSKADPNSLPFSTNDFISLPTLAAKLTRPSTKISQYLRSRFSETTLQLLAGYKDASSDPKPLQEALIQELNKITKGDTVYDEERFAAVTLSTETRRLLVQSPRRDALVRLNRLLLVDAYPLDLAGSKKSTTRDVSILLRKLNQEKVDGVILDLRRNGGGSLEEAINLTGLFIKKGPVVQVKDPDDKVDVDEDTDPSVLYDGPLVVLTSRFSASASEILAGALQDYGRALIVGDSSTHGKGTVQSLIELNRSLGIRGPSAQDPGALKVTIKKFYRASGSSTQLKGVVPDLVLPSLNNHGEVGEASLDNPLPWDTIASAKYEKLNRVLPYLSELQKRSAKRLETDKDFAYLREDIEQRKKLLADKSVSLNEEQRLKEKEEDEAKAKARQQELKSRPETNEKAYDLTLKLAELPGLPPPTIKTNAVAKVEGNVQAKEGDEEDSSGEPKLPAVDVTLKEAKQILIDLIALSSGEPVVAAANAK
jgi:C-terminal processing protease CtpA/Prc